MYIIVTNLWQFTSLNWPLEVVRGVENFRSVSFVLPPLLGEKKVVGYPRFYWTHNSGFHSTPNIEQFLATVNLKFLRSFLVQTYPLIPFNLNCPSTVLWRKEHTIATLIPFYGKQALMKNDLHVYQIQFTHKSQTGDKLSKQKSPVVSSRFVCLSWLKPVSSGKENK